MGGGVVETDSQFLRTTDVGYRPISSTHVETEMRLTRFDESISIVNALKMTRQLRRGL